MRRTHFAFVVSIVFLSFSLRAAEPAEEARELPRPQWAWGTLAFRNVEDTLTQLAQYFDRVATNSGALARLSLTTVLFPVPMEDGLKKDGPALIFFVDPGLAGGQRGEKALLLSVADPKVLKESLEAVFGADMKEGLLQVTVPRGFNEPDATLLIKLAPAGLLVAPNAQILKELETVAGAKGAAQFIGANGPDVLAEVNFDVLRRIEQQRLEDLLGRAVKATSLAAPTAASQVEEGQQRLQKFLKELDRLELSARIEAREIRLTAQLRALADTELSQRWDRAPEAPAGTWNLWCNPETALFVTGRFPAAWAFAEKDTAVWLAKYMPTEGAPGRAAQEAAARELSAWLGQLGGDLAFEVRANQEGSFFPLTMFGVKGEADVLAGFEKLLTPTATLLAERLRTDFELPGDAPVPAVLEKTGDAQTGVARQTVKFQDPKAEAWAKKRFEAMSGWPLEFSMRHAAGGLVLGWGKGADACIAAEPAVRGDGHNPFGVAPKGTAGCALLQPATVMRVYLRQWCHLDEAATQRVLNGLANTPLCAYWGQGDGAVQLELRAPVESLRTGMESYLRMLKEGFDPGVKPAKE
jgi:hypothetical protein